MSVSLRVPAAVTDPRRVPPVGTPSVDRTTLVLVGITYAWAVIYYAALLESRVNIAIAAALLGAVLVLRPGVLFPLLVVSFFAPSIEPFAGIRIAWSDLVGLVFTAYELSQRKNVTRYCFMGPLLILLGAVAYLSVGFALSFDPPPEVARWGTRGTSLRAVWQLGQITVNIMLAFAVAAHLADRDRHEFFWRNYLWLAWPVTLIGLYQTVASVTPLPDLGAPTGNKGLEWISSTAAGTVRTTSVYGEPGVYGFFLLGPLFALVAQAPSQRGRSRQILLMLIVLNLFLTFSRGAWIGAILGLLFTSTVRGDFRRFVRVGAAVAVAAALGLYVSSRFLNIQSGRWLESAEQPIQSLSSQLVGSRAANDITGRAGIHTFALELAREHPVLGVGVAYGPLWLGDRFRVERISGSVGAYYGILSEMGILGLLVHVLIAVVFLRRMAHIARNRRQAWLAPAALAIVGWMVATLTHYYGISERWEAYTFFTIGIGSAVAWLTANTSDPLQEPRGYRLHQFTRRAVGHAASPPCE